MTTRTRPFGSASQWIDAEIGRRSIYVARQPRRN